jgi:hypothetical protein
VRRSSGPTVVRRRLGTALRDLRETANIRIERAARELECSTAKISRLENGLGPAKNWEVRVLLDLYGVQDEATRRRFDSWATKTKSAGWWEQDADLTDEDEERYLAVETESVLLRMYCTPVLPTLLHTASYNFAHLRAFRPYFEPADVERFAKLRHSRQSELLDPDNPLRLVAVVDEGAVRRQVGSREIHAEQLAWLADLLDDIEAQRRDDIQFRVFPFTAGTPSHAMSAYSLFTPREADLDPVTAYVEDTYGGSWYEKFDDVAALEGLFERLLARSLSPQDSRALLRSL